MEKPRNSLQTSSVQDFLKHKKEQCEVFDVYLRVSGLTIQMRRPGAKKLILGDLIPDRLLAMVRRNKGAMPKLRLDSSTAELIDEIKPKAKEIALISVVTPQVKAGASDLENNILGVDDIDDLDLMQIFQEAMTPPASNVAQNEEAEQVKKFPRKQGKRPNKSDM